MTRNELESWRDFYLLHPFDARSIHFRPAALIAASNMRDGFQKIDQLMDWLDPTESSVALGEGWTPADLSTFKALGIKPPPYAQPRS